MNFSKYTTQELEFITSNVELLKKELEKRNVKESDDAKWADEHPNLYNDEKYHTVKVSYLDELYRKAEMYDTFLEKACEWIKNNKHLHKILWFDSLSTDWDKFIREFRKAMEE